MVASGLHTNVSVKVCYFMSPSVQYTHPCINFSGKTCALICSYMHSNYICTVEVLHA